jgi:uncharacterized coiled-coil DUF342 family protein
MSTYLPVNWKAKHKERSAEVKALTKRLNEVKAGRENWKNKYEVMKIERDELDAELQKIKKKILSIL